MTSSGELAYLRPPPPIDDEFVARAEEGRLPEARFRFAEPCVEQGCANWTEAGRCSVADRVVASQDDGDPGDRLPACGIRGSCRWFAQVGREACRGCPFVLHSEVSTATVET
ncbi:hypothetical protein [Blastococcus sp. CT_GayMR16]|uniref:hypothetical protein n=1 Tax=Blastococcus sp. CT_GayMR16 TaxID=2559607 RepID=UPI0010733109|nr:hypothetical protein [Blastococcus sp. CT_GayMR16]TFV86281.1 hypothetical protein E4P38_17400 [Blastococcus sp. CT_GayMR16]